MIRAGTISRVLEDKVNREMESGERVLWMEQPIPRYFTAMSTGTFLFAIPWTAFALFWISGASGFKLPDFGKGGFSLFPLFGKRDGNPAAVSPRFRRGVQQERKTDNVDDYMPRVREASFQ